MHDSNIDVEGLCSVPYMVCAAIFNIQRSNDAGRSERSMSPKRVSPVQASFQGDKKNGGRSHGD